MWRILKTTITPLHKSPIGKEVTVIAIRFSGIKKKRILDLGIKPNTKITLLQKSPYGNPIAYLVRGAIIAIRNEDARKIIVEY